MSHQNLSQNLTYKRSNNCLKLKTKSFLTVNLALSFSLAGQRAFMLRLIMVYFSSLEIYWSWVVPTVITDITVGNGVCLYYKRSWKCCKDIGTETSCVLKQKLSGLFWGFFFFSFLKNLSWSQMWQKVHESRQDKLCNCIYIKWRSETKKLKPGNQRARSDFIYFLLHSKVFIGCELIKKAWISVQPLNREKKGYEFEATHHQHAC